MTAHMLIVIHILDFCLADVLMHNAPDFVVNWVRLGLSGGHKSHDINAGVMSHVPED